MMNNPYELLDFGRGRKLEQFGEYRLDRPCPAADDMAPTADPNLWAEASQFRRQKGKPGDWKGPTLPKSWPCQFGPLQFELRPTPFGHVGVFPEQQSHWRWIRSQVDRSDQPLRVLNLFAYTGGSTLAAALGGAEVTHVDAAKGTVTWARENAARCGLAEAPIRWIVDDAYRFVEREVRRAQRYDAIILDPPSYGHGPKGRVWAIDEDLLPLLTNLRQILSDRLQFVLMTCHSPGWNPPIMEAILSDTLFGSCAAGARGNDLFLNGRNGRKLHCGVAARWPA